jgi:hypothetical protein
MFSNSSPTPSSGFSRQASSKSKTWRKRAWSGTGSSDAPDAVPHGAIVALRGRNDRSRAQSRRKAANDRSSAGSPVSPPCTVCGMSGHQLGLVKSDSGGALSWLEGTLRTGRGQIPEGARSASPGLLESDPWRRLTMSEHREHLLPDTADIFLPRGAATVGLHADRRQRIYRWPRSSRACRLRRVAARDTLDEAPAA